MYIPSFNKFPNQQEAINFMHRYSFATIVTADNNVPLATHLPFLVEQRGDKIFLLSHFAKANPQASSLIGKPVLVIFTEPHAYISPANYEKETNVPTWNYIAVHAYGRATLIAGGDETAKLLAKTIANFEAGYLQQWNGLPDDYRQKMMNGIVAFEIEVDDLQGKQKLSQNRSAIERENIVGSLSKSDNNNESEVADYMSKLK